MHILINLIIEVMTIYLYVIFAGAVLSWIQPNPYNPIIRFIYRITEPAYAFVRRFVPCVFYGLDFAPMIVIFGIILAQRGLLMLF